MSIGRSLTLWLILAFLTAALAVLVNKIMFEVIGGILFHGL